MLDETHGLVHDHDPPLFVHEPDCRKLGLGAMFAAGLRLVRCTLGAAGGAVVVVTCTVVVVDGGVEVEGVVAETVGVVVGVPVAVVSCTATFRGATVFTGVVARLVGVVVATSTGTVVAGVEVEGVVTDGVVVNPGDAVVVVTCVLAVGTSRAVATTLADTGSDETASMSSVTNIAPAPMSSERRTLGRGVAPVDGDFRVVRNRSFQLLSDCPCAEFFMVQYSRIRNKVLPTKYQQAPNLPRGYLVGWWQ